LAKTKRTAKRGDDKRGEQADAAAEPSPIEASDSTAYSVTLPMFEGPLDLLLHLCQKHELQILDIPISFVTEKYLEYLAVMQLMNLDVAAEYLVMAATLAHIKSKMLLPAPPPGQEDDELLEEEDPREALIRRLLEYQKYKLAAEQLGARGVAGRDVFYRGSTIEEAVETGLPPLAEIPLFTLVEAFNHVLARSNVRLSHDIVADRISITDRIHELADVLTSRRRILFEELFAGAVTKFDLVITFLACLEMTRLKMTRLFQTEPLAPLYIEMTGEPVVIGDDDDVGAPPPAEAVVETVAAPEEAEPEEEELS
jgi:segregation and condensation protein A